MELKLNTNCQLFVEGVPEHKNGYIKIELVVSDSNPSDFIVETNRTNNRIVYDLPTDGLYHYYEINWPEDKPMETMEKIIASLELGNLQEDQEVEVYPLSIFSICKLRNCTLNLEKQAISDFINNKRSCKTSTRDYKDILLISVFVLENLICQNRYAEAGMLLDKLVSCSDLCENKPIKSCNC